MQHHYWKWYQPECFLSVSREDIRKYGQIIPDAYKYFDKWLGEVRANLSPDTVLIIASDHGHAPCILHEHAYSQHRHGPPGIILLTGGPVRKKNKLRNAHVLDIFPTMLYLLGLPLPEDGDGILLEDALDQTFLQRFPPHKVKTYDSFLKRSLAPKKKGLLDKEELERLKSLGYIR